MLITNGNAMAGVVFDNTGEMAMRLDIGDCLTYGFLAFEGICRLRAGA